MKRISAAVCLLVGWSFASAAAPFESGDTVVFFGDSITHGGRYHEFVTDYYRTRFPEARIRFVNSGIGGDTCAGARPRIPVDVAEYDPTWVCFHFGMNDVSRGSYAATPTAAMMMGADAAQEAFGRNLATLVGAVRKAVPSARFVYFTPTPYDDTAVVTNLPANAPAWARTNQVGCNTALALLSGRVLRKAESDGALGVNWYSPLESFLMARRAKDPHYMLTSWDRVHPGALGHSIMAWEFLLAQGAPAVVSSVVLDAAKGEALSCERAAVSGVTASDGGLSFTVLAEALPMPVAPEALEAAREWHVEERLNRETLRITGLAAGDYAVDIDGGRVGVWTAAELAKGISLGFNDRTPQYRQAQLVFAKTRELTERERVLRNHHSARWFYGQCGAPVDDVAAFKAWFGQDGRNDGGHFAAFVPGYLAYWPTYRETRAALWADQERVRALAKPLPHRYAVRRMKAVSAARTSVDFNDGWSFSKDGGAARTVRLPHDWAVDGGFTLDVPGNEGHLPYPGTGIYRKTFATPDGLAAGERVWLEIDGAMSHSSVQLNGTTVSSDRPYGYVSYKVDLTDALRPRGGENELEIRLDVPPRSTRYYSGAGLFRDVRLVRVPRAHIAYDGVRVRTETLADGRAKVRVDVETEGVAPAKVDLEVSRGGRAVASVRDAEPQAELLIGEPEVWSPETPNLYTLTVWLKDGARRGDSVCVRFGVRTVEFVPGKGFFLNGAHRQMKGVCLHHDLGPLGGAFSVDAARRQLALMKEMGADAVRTTHNPPDPKFLDLCDEMGLMVMDEAFDMWELAKNDNDYHLQFRAWHERDLVDFVKRDRNHPCVMLWSIGNEVQEHVRDPVAGYRIGTNLTEIVSRHDERPTTVACWCPIALTNGMQKTVKVFGANYLPWHYEKFIKDNPDRCIIGSETESVLSSRGVYLHPWPAAPNNTVGDDPQPFFYGKGPDGRGGWGVLTNVYDRIFRDGQVTGYDVACYQANLNHPPDTQFKYQELNPSCCGMFTWTGIDYLGEPTPFSGKGERNRSANFGAMDLCGFPKDRYWLFKSHWRPDVPTAHIVPANWNWTPGMEMPVHVYSSGDEAELFVNGRSQGRRAKGRFKYRFVWEKVRYEPGEVKVVTWKGGRPWATETVKTAGDVARLLVEKEFEGGELAYFRIKAVDGAGNFVPTAAVPFAVRPVGGEIAGVCNGDPTDWTPFKSDRLSTFNGLAQVILRGRGARCEIIR